MTPKFDLRISDEENKIYEFNDVYELAEFVAFYYPDAFKEACPLAGLEKKERIEISA